MKITGLRLFMGFVLGTTLNGIIFTGFTWVNATPVPSMRTPGALLRYPTGNPWLTLGISGFLYAGSMIATALSFSREDWR